MVLLLKPTAGAAAATAAGAGAATAAAAACAGTAGRSITICRGCQHHAQELVARLYYAKWECGARLQRASTTPYRLSALRAGLSTVAYSRGSEHTARACNACVCVCPEADPHGWSDDGDRDAERDMGGFILSAKVKPL